jgi:hypothetical protein
MRLFVRLTDSSLGWVANTSGLRTSAYKKMFVYKTKQYLCYLLILKNVFRGHHLF